MCNVLYIQARDKAGNLSQISSYTVNIDTAPPALALKTEDLSSAYKKDSSAAVTLTAKDENGYLWEFEGEGFEEDTEVKLIMETNHTDSNIFDDKVIDVR